MWWTQPAEPHMGSTLTFMSTETELHSHLPTCCTMWVPAARFRFLSCHHTLKVADLVRSRPEDKCNWCGVGIQWVARWHSYSPTQLYPHPICPQVWIPHFSQQHRPRDAALQLFFEVLVGYCLHTHSVWLLSGLGSSANSTGSKLELRPDQQADRCNWRWQPIPSHNGWVANSIFQH